MCESHRHIGTVREERLPPPPSPVKEITAGSVAALPRVVADNTRKRVLEINPLQAPVAVAAPVAHRPVLTPAITAGKVRDEIQKVAAKNSTVTPAAAPVVEMSEAKKLAVRLMLQRGCDRHEQQKLNAHPHLKLRYIEELAMELGVAPNNRAIVKEVERIFGAAEAGVLLPRFLK